MEPLSLPAFTRPPGRLRRCWPRATVPGAGRGEGARRSRRRSRSWETSAPQSSPLAERVLWLAAGLGRCGQAGRPVSGRGGQTGQTHLPL